MFQTQTPSLALESGSWTVPVLSATPAAITEKQPAESVWQRLKRSKFACLMQLVLLLRYLLSRQQHLILTGFHRVCGDRFRLPLWRSRLVVLSDPQAIKEVLEQDAEVMSAGSMRKRIIGVLPQHCLFYAEGEQHETMRRLVGKAFGQATQRLDLNETFGHLACELQSVPVDLRPASIRQGLITLAEKLVFGSSDPVTNELAIRMRQSFDGLHSAGMIFPVLRLIPQFGRPFKRYRQVQTELQGVIEERMTSGETGDGFLHQLHKGSAGELSDHEVRDNAAFIFLVVLRTLMPMFRNVAHALAVETKWQNKLRAADGEGESLYRAVVKETLRLTPFVPIFGRHAQRDIEVDGFQIAKGEIVIISPMLTHYRPAAFSDPERFNPERFTGREKHRYQFLPFGGGQHHCIGAGWSMQVTSHLVRSLLPYFELASSQPHAEAKSLTLRAIFLSRQQDGLVIADRG
ncbi:MAG: cytochrome P450 [Pirellulaceae bacterium]